GRAGAVVIAGYDVMKDGGGKGAARQRVDVRVDISKAGSARLLLNQSDDSGERGCRDRRSAKCGAISRCLVIKLSVRAGRLDADEIAVMVGSCVERDIRDVAREVVRHSGALLPRWLGKKRAGPATARTKGGRGSSDVFRRLVPDCFGNIALCRTIRVPVSPRALIEHRAAKAGDIGRASRKIDRQALSGRIDAGIAVGSTIVTGGAEDCDALSIRLLKGLIESAQLSKRVAALAFAVTHCHNRREIFINRLDK